MNPHRTPGFVQDEPTPTLEERLRAAEKEVADKAAEKRAAKKLAYQKRRLEFLAAKNGALDRYDPEQLLEADVENLGWSLLHWPDDATYEHFMKHSGALRGDLSKLTMTHVEDLIARCTIFPAPAVFLAELREKNAGARTVLVDKLLAAMRKRVAEEGK